MGAFEGKMGSCFCCHVCIITSWRLTHLFYFLYIASCVSFKEVKWLPQDSSTIVKSENPCLLCSVLLPDGLLALRVLHVPVLGLFVPSGLGAAALPGALFPMQLSQTSRQSRDAVQREVDTDNNVWVTQQVMILSLTILNLTLFFFNR